MDTLKRMTANAAMNQFLLSGAAMETEEIIELSDEDEDSNQFSVDGYEPEIEEVDLFADDSGDEANRNPDTPLSPKLVSKILPIRKSANLAASSIKQGYMNDRQIESFISKKNQKGNVLAKKSMPTAPEAPVFPAKPQMVKPVSSATMTQPAPIAKQQPSVPSQLKPAAAAAAVSNSSKPSGEPSDLPEKKTVPPAKKKASHRVPSAAMLLHFAATNAEGRFYYQEKYQRQKARLANETPEQRALRLEKKRGQSKAYRARVSAAIREAQAKAEQLKLNTTGGTGQASPYMYKAPKLKTFADISRVLQQQRQPSTPFPRTATSTSTATVASLASKPAPTPVVYPSSAKPALPPKTALPTKTALPPKKASLSPKKASPTSESPTKKSPTKWENPIMEYYGVDAEWDRLLLAQEVTKTSITRSGRQCKAKQFYD